MTAGSCLLIGFAGIGQVAEPPPASAILEDLRNFDTLGSVLYIAAHPDDEDTQLITFLARGRHYRSAYLSVNRGDGGQNVLGPEFGAGAGRHPHPGTAGRAPAGRRRAVFHPRD
jgi:hypothetical protein